MVNNPFNWGGTSLPQVTQKPATQSNTNSASWMSPQNAPSAVFSGDIPAVDYTQNPYLLNQIQQFQQMQQPTQGVQDAFSARMQGMGGQAQQLFNPVQDASLGNGLLGGNLQLNTVLPGYTQDNKVGYTDNYGNGATNPDGIAGTTIGATKFDPAKLWAYSNLTSENLNGLGQKDISNVYNAMGKRIQTEIKDANARYKTALKDPTVGDWRREADRLATLNQWAKQYKLDLKGSLGKIDKKTKLYVG